jgi:fumarylacetoacetase
MIDRTHDPNRTSWVQSANAPGCDFPIQNLPFVNFRPQGDAWPRAGVAIGDRILDIAAVFKVAIADIMAMSREERVDLRARIGDYLERHQSGAERHLHPISSELRLPCDIGNYTDFYASIHHARNVGALFRPDNPLLPNYKWVPVAYHGRASSIVISGTAINRPCGQLSGAAGAPPVYAPTRKLDYELEVGAFLGPGNDLGRPIPIDNALDHLVGVCLLNDWSARDIQAWEYQPLGPFLAKSLATSISPFIVTAEALEPFRCDPDPRPNGDPAPLPYLAGGHAAAYDIHLEAWLSSRTITAPVRLSRGNFRSMYWTLVQMIAHHTSNGCNLRPGDLIGSGTVSGPDPDSRGCLLELTQGGKSPIALLNGETRAFLEDGDEVILRGWCEAPGFRRIGLGECRGIVLPAIHSE